MKQKVIYAIVLLVGLILGFWAGHQFAIMETQAIMTSGPWSDDVMPAIQTLSLAKSKIKDNDANVIKELEQTEHHLEHISEWMRIWPKRPNREGESGR